MAYTQDHLDALQEAIATGELEVKFDDHLVRYRSISELKAAYEFVKKEMAVSNGVRRKTLFRIGVNNG